VGINGTAYGPALTAPTNAGNYEASATFAGDTNHNGSSGFADFTIAKAALTIKANDATRSFGMANPSFSVTYTGFVNHETPSVLGGTLSITTTATPTSPPGTYPITPNGQTSSNYAITYVPGTLTVSIPNSIYVLGRQSCDDGNNGLIESGNASINVPGVVVVEPGSREAIEVRGMSSLTASSVQVVGGTDIDGKATVSPAPTHITSPGDPLAGLPALTAASIAGLTNYISLGQGFVKVAGNTVKTINPGIYSGIEVSGNGQLTMNPGTYVLEGEGLTVSGNGSLKGACVFIYNTGSKFPSAGGEYTGITLKGTGTINLSPATSGTYANILIFQSRSNTRALQIQGQVVANLSGTIYAPAALVDMDGNGNMKTTLVVGALNLSGNTILTQLAQGVTGTPDTVGFANTLISGNLYVYINDPSGFFTSDMLARIQDAIDGLDNLLLPYNVTITEVTDPTQASLVIDAAATSAVGSAADGVLGCWNPNNTEITILQGWNWYAGADPTLIGANQYDFQTTMTHELGHALGLGGSQTDTSPMNEFLPAGTTRRTMTAADLNVAEAPSGADPLTAAGVGRRDSDTPAFVSPGNKPVFSSPRFEGLQPEGHTIVLVGLAATDGFVSWPVFAANVTPAHVQAVLDRVFGADSSDGQGTGPAVGNLLGTPFSTIHQQAHVRPATAGAEFRPAGERVAPGTACTVAADHAALDIAVMQLTPASLQPPMTCAWAWSVSCRMTVSCWAG
jgi:hypothetical protein